MNCKGVVFSVTSHWTVRYYNEKGNVTRRIDDYRSRHVVRETTHSLDGAAAVTLESNQYDALGRLASVQRGGCDSLATAYAYNPRGWTTQISGPLFTENLYYATQRDTSSVPCWNGNISAMDWKAGADSTYDAAYDFRYDRMSRLTSALWDGNGLGCHNERSYGYDLNGNLLSVEKGVSSSTLSNHNVDLTSLTLVGNQDRYAQTSRNPAIPLRRPIIPPLNAQKRTAYIYDAAGNHVSSVTESRMTDDDPWLAGDTEYEAQYNRLNLPSHRQGISEEEWTVYSADGVKQALYHRIPEFVSLFPALIPSTPEINWRFDYAGNYIFRDGVLDRILTPGGHIDCSGASPSYQWWLTDHLGNVRVVADAAGQVVQTSHYDPYGGDISVWDVSATPILEPTYLAEENLFRFGGKEWSRHFSDYDFGARYYSTSHHRFSTMDPLAEKYYNLSPYAYCAGNPVRYVDPRGLWYWSENEDDHALYWEEGDNVETLAQFLNITEDAANQIYKRRSHRKMHEGSYISKEDLWYETRLKGRLQADNTPSAILLYYLGGGKERDIGDASNNEIFRAPKITKMLNSIISGEAPQSGSIYIDMTLKIFHIGRTTVSFQILTGENANSVVFKTLSNDGFWDPNFIQEWIDDHKATGNQSDQKGSNYELGGRPYHYAPRYRTYFYKPH